MARTAVTVTEFNANAETDEPSGTAADATNDHSVSGHPLEEVLLYIENGSGQEMTATVKAGSNPPALSAGQGDLEVSIATSSNSWIGPFESARFEQGANVLHLDLDVDTTSTVTAFHVPRDF